MMALASKSGPAAAAAAAAVTLNEPPTTRTMTTTTTDERRAQQQAKAEGELARELSPPTRPSHETKPFVAQLIWPNVLLFALLHLTLPLGVHLIWTRRPWRTLAWTIASAYLAMFGVLGGAHRLWSHRAFKARLPARLLFVALQTMAGQNSIYTWVLDHRVHHKYTETDADPHNIKRGFFFAHMGWNLCERHPEVRRRRAQIDVADVRADSLVIFQHRHFWPLALVFHLLLPTLIPVLLWNESLLTSFVLSFAWRYLLSLHATWLINSVAHYHGERPYDARIEARESPLLIYIGAGPGFHNYHHTFPQDYAASEHGRYFNLTTLLIDALAALGLVYERRKASENTIRDRKLRTGAAQASLKCRAVD